MKANYKKFGEYFADLDELGIGYSLKDMVRKAWECHTPIPIDIQLMLDAGKFKVLERLAYMWRRAENYYLKTMSDWQKQRVAKIQAHLKLNQEQTMKLQSICNSMGV